MNLQRSIQPQDSDLKRLLQRPVADNTTLSEVVRSIIQHVMNEGDSALLHYTHTFDSPLITSIAPYPLNEEELEIDETMKKALLRAKDNIERFHASQKQEPISIEIEEGVTLWRKSLPLERVGLYIPGGSAPLFSTLLMLATPARLAGCSEIMMCTPAQKDGTIDPILLYLASLFGITEVYPLGGAQAIAAMAYGTESIQKVDKIFGPGNSYVTEAKMQVQHVCAIDMPAGPSEVMVVADRSSNASFVASDLLSQAEHGADSQVMLIIYDSDIKQGSLIADNVEDELKKQLKSLKRSEIATQALSHSNIFIVDSIKRVITIMNQYAPEHLLLQTSFNDTLTQSVQHAGSVFVGSYSCEATGDYASGTNHTLPTSGWARSYSGVNLDSFMKSTTFQHVTKKGLLSLGPTVELMAKREGLDAHAHAVNIRLQELKHSLN
ncbi:MAG: histidinol dehydrogenase [Sphaerochaetaceae bacterium]